MNLWKIIKNKILFLLILILLLPTRPLYARSTPHHIYNIFRCLTETIGAPFYGIFVQGPKNMKKLYKYEVWGREKPEKRGKFRYKFFAVLMAPGVGIKATIDGLTSSVSSFGEASKEFVSIFFGD